MLPRADVITVHPVGRADALVALEGVGDARQEAFQRSLAGLVGKSLTGEVLSRLTDGSYIVRVAGASARMLLPQGARVGAEVPLKLVAVSPRPTFELAQPDGRAASVVYTEAGPPLLPGALGTPARAAPLQLQETALPLASAPPPDGEAPQPGAAAARQGGEAPRVLSHAAALLNKAPLVPADRLPALTPNSPPASLSEAARVIGTVLATAREAGSPAPAIVARTPLLAAPAPEPQQLAVALKEALSSSGLFYESHVAEWADGKRALGDLVREPQMQRALNSQALDAAARQASPASDPATAQFINQQLHTQEQGRVAWQGQPWPGLPMQWEVQRDAREERGRDGEPAEPAWRSGVRFQFALLGEVTANVVLSGGQLQVRVQAASEETGALLRASAASLAGALEAAGTPLAGLDIRGPRDGGDE